MKLNQRKKNRNISIQVETKKAKRYIRKKMPFRIKKYFRELKSEVSEHFWLAKNKNRLLNRQKIDDCKKTTSIIRNDLRRSNKNEKNSYRDYSKNCDEILFYQNNCALRCDREEKLQNDIVAEERKRSIKCTNLLCTNKSDSDECNEKNCENDSIDFL